MRPLAHHTVERNGGGQLRHLCEAIADPNLLPVLSTSTTYLLLRSGFVGWGATILRYEHLEAGGRA